DAPFVFDHLAREAIGERHTLILDHYEARRKQADGALKDAVPYKPVPPAALALSPDEVTAGLAERVSVELTPFAAPEATAVRILHAGARAGKRFEQERAD